MENILPHDFFKRFVNYHINQWNVGQIQTSIIVSLFETTLGFSRTFDEIAMVWKRLSSPSFSPKVSQPDLIKGSNIINSALGNLSHAIVAAALIGSGTVLIGETTAIDINGLLSLLPLISQDQQTIIPPLMFPVYSFTLWVMAAYNFLRINSSARKS